MRPIDNKHLRRATSLVSLNAASVAIGTALEIDWDEYLRRNREEATTLRTGLWAVGCMKCWFSEAILQQGEGHIEHYRPKGAVTGAQHDGYKWETFNWSNLRLAHATVNLRRTDYLTKRKMGKGSYFPLRDAGRRANNPAEEINEEPVLLDPVVASDTLLICFDETSGAPKSRFRKEDDPWLHRRAADSIDYYHLDEGTWNAKRADLIGEVRELCNQLEKLAVAQPRDEKAYSQKIDEIVEYISPFAEFSTACLQIVSGKGLLEYFVPAMR